MTPARRHWLLALAVAVVLHVGVTVAVLWQAPRSGAQSAGAGGLEVSLGPAGGAPGSVELEVPEAAEAEPAAEPPAEVPPRTVEADTPAPAEPAVAEAEPVAAEPEAAVPEPTEVVAANAAPAPPVTQVEAVAPEPEPEAAPEPNEAREPERPPEVTAEPQTAEAATTEPVETAEAMPERETVAAGEAGSGGEGGTRDRRDQGSGDHSAAGGAAGVQADYIAALRAWLERHKEYPRRARMRRQEGIAVLHFVIDRSGEVLAYEIRESSGHSALDREVEAMVQRASPLPAMPDDMSRERLELVVPVRFSLR